MFWNDQVNISIHSYSLNHIHGKGGDEDREWCFTSVYGFPEESKKKKTWELLKTVSVTVTDDWICFGDFNDTLFASENRGGNPRSFEELSLGRNSVEECGLPLDSAVIPILGPMEDKALIISSADLT